MSTLRVWDRRVAAALNTHRLRMTIKCDQELPGHRHALPRGAALPAAGGLRRAGEREGRHLRPRPGRVLGDGGARARVLVRAVHRAVRLGAPVREVVRRREAQRLLQLRRPPRRVGACGQVAYHWEGEPQDERRGISFGELQREVVRFANAFRALGVAKGTPVAIYMGMVPELPIAMLAWRGSARRLRSSSAGSRRVAVRPNERHGLRGARHPGRGLAEGHECPAEGNADAALAESPSVRKAVVLNGAPAATWTEDGPRRLVARRGRGRERRPGDLPVRADGFRGPALPALHQRDDRQPKGIAHTTAGYLVGVATTHHYIFDVKPDSVYWCAADIGWVTGHSYIVYGPLCNGTTA